MTLSLTLNLQCEQVSYTDGSVIYASEQTVIWFALQLLEFRSKQARGRGWGGLIGTGNYFQFN